MDQFGYAIAAMLKKAGDLSNNDRTMADELSQQLLAAEDRITQIERKSFNGSKIARCAPKHGFSTFNKPSSKTSGFLRQPLT